jgi:hypothetical protein
LGEVIDVIGQVIAAGFLARLDQNDATRVRHPLLAQCQEGAQRPEHRISVIGSAAAVELVAFETRDPRAVALGPSDHLRLLVEMTIEQHGLPTFARDIDEDDWRAPGQSDDFEGRTRKGRELRARPALEQRHGLVHKAVRRPIRVEGRRFVRDLDVFDQDRDDLVAPALIDEFSGPRDIDHLKAPGYDGPPLPAGGGTHGS